MQEASDATASGLFFVHGLKKEDLQEKLKEILKKNQHRKRNFETFIDIVIDSYPKGHVVGATVDCEDDILSLTEDKVSKKLCWHLKTVQVDKTYNYYMFLSLCKVCLIFRQMLFDFQL